MFSGQQKKLQIPRRMLVASSLGMTISEFRDGFAELLKALASEPSVALRAG
jgi:hypothetical protein